MVYKPLNLDEAGEWGGLWWLQGEPDKQIPGILRYDGEGGLLLSLIGAFEDRITSTPVPGVTFFHTGIKTWDVIHGVAQQHEITLLDCVPTSSERVLFAQVNSPDTQNVRAKIAIIGAHVAGEDDTAFVAAEVSVEDLGLWAASSVFRHSVGTRDDGKNDGTGTISVKPVETQTVTVDGTDYCLEHTHTLPFFDQRKSETIGRMRDTAFIRICRTQPFTLSTALKDASLIQDLIALATHRAAGLIWLQLEVAGIELTQENGKSLPRRRTDVLYSPAMLGKHNAKAADFNRILFTCKTISFKEIMPRWCEKHKQLQAAINMILGLRYASVHFIESDLLLAAGAAEALHRGLHIDEKPFPSTEFKKMRKEMLAQVPEKYHDRLKEMIRNDPTLRNRLCALADRLDPEVIKQLVPDVDYWAKRTTRARNDLAHEGETSDHSIEELLIIVKVTTAVVIFNILHELGLPIEQQRQIVREHPQLRAVYREASERLISKQP